jgi:hypothetical protein
MQLQLDRASSFVFIMQRLGCPAAYCAGAPPPFRCEGFERIEPEMVKNQIRKLKRQMEIPGAQD